MGNQNVRLNPPNERYLSSISNSPLEDINLIWLDALSHDKTGNSPQFLSELRNILHSVRTFTDQNICEEFLRNEVNDNQIVFLIVSGSLGEQFVPRIHDLTSIDSIYVFCLDVARHESWSNPYSKLKGKVFFKVPDLCHRLKEDIHHCQNDLIPMHILKPTPAPDQLNQLEPSFMYSQLLKEVLINIEYDENAKNDFVKFYRSQMNNSDSDQMKIIDEFEKDYEKHSPSWWYTRECFVYHMINKALRAEDVDILIKMGFFIRDLHRQIANLYSSQERSTPGQSSMIVYRGQGMSINQFEKINNSKGGLITFPNFLSTSREKQVALNFTRHALEKPGLRGIIFHMDINLSLLNSSNPYAVVEKNLSYYPNYEKEIIFSTNTVFRIEDIRPAKDDNKIWQIYLKLVTNQDVQLEQLTKHIRQDVQLTSANSWEPLAKLLCTLREFDKALQIYEKMLKKTSSDDYEELAYINHQLGYVYSEKNNLDQALEYFQNSLNIKRTYLLKTSHHPQLADTFLNIGSIYHAQGNLANALHHFQDALQTNTTNQKLLASLHNNIGTVLKKQKSFSKALEHFEKSLEIDKKQLPTTHPDLAITHTNIGNVYFSLQNYDKALSCYEEALAIRRVSLPSNHPYLLQALRNYENTAMLVSETRSNDSNTSMLTSTNSIQSVSSAPAQDEQQSSKLKLSKLTNIEFDVKNECSIKLETDHGIETCLNQKCSDFKDPWRVINSHRQDQPCYLHYLKLSFTTYDQLLVFIELQQSSHIPLEHFFSNDDDTKHCGPEGRIDILQIEILNWYNSPRSVVQIIENDIVDKQPFQQITIFYPCNIRRSMERLVLAKYLVYQERSSCPTQINIIKGEDLLMSNDDTIHIQKYKPLSTFQKDYPEKFNITYDSFNKSHSIDNQKSNGWNLFAKILIILIIIIIIIAFIIYHYYCLPSQSRDTLQ